LDLTKQSPAGAYDPTTYRMLSFQDAVAKFRDGSDHSRAYLERCIERIEALDGAVMAFAFLNLERARQAADQSGARYKAGKPLSAVDGMPVGIKDLIETYDRADITRSARRTRAIAGDARRTGKARRRVRHPVVTWARAHQHGSRQRDLQRDVVSAGCVGHEPAPPRGRRCAFGRPIAGALAA
ncbi:MAG: amidase family protein, partial [Hyphomicrobiales bacterium]